MDLQLIVVVLLGVFAAGTVGAAWRSRTWLAMNLSDFKIDFSRTITVADKLQPVLAIAALGAIGAYVLSSGEPGKGFAIGAGGILVGIIVISLTTLVPLQRRIINRSESADATERLRSRWVRGHLARTAAALAAFFMTTYI
jgi:hypothetical protein